MRSFILALLAGLFLLGCSTPRYVYKAESAGYFQSYKEMMFKAEDFQAAYYLKDAIKSAKQEEHLDTLAKLYLGSCAIELALYKTQKCALFESIEPLLEDKKYEAYKAFILAQNFQKDAESLAKYRDFMVALEEKNPQSIQKSIEALPDIYAKAIAVSIVKRINGLSVDLINVMIEEAEKNSMKGVLLTYMKEKISYFEAHGKKEKAERLAKRLEILSR